MPTRNEIIEDLFTGKDFNDCISKVNPKGLRDDLRQEVALFVCEIPEEKLIQLNERKELRFYVARTIFHFITNKYHPFYKKFRTVHQELSDHEKIDEPEDSTARAAKERVEDLIISEILAVGGNHPDWYHNTLLRLYIEVGNYRAIEHATQIPYASCYKSIQKYMTQLKGKARNLELCQKK